MIVKRATREAISGTAGGVLSVTGGWVRRFTQQTVTPVVWSVILTGETDGVGNIIFIFSAVLMLTFFGQAFGYETHGRISINNYFLTDSSDASDYNISTLRVNLKADKIAGEKSRLIFNSRSRFRAGGREYSSEIPDHRINSLYLHLGGLTESLETDLGRLFVADARGVRVDGVNVKYVPGGEKRAGVFAGGEPDPFKESFNTDFFTFGGYFSHQGKRAGFGVSSVTSYFRGRLDRSLVYIHSFLKPPGRARLSHSITLDYDKVDKSVKFTDINLALDASFPRGLRLRLGYNRYQPVIRFESMNYKPAENREDSYTLNLSCRGFRNYFIYSGAGYRYRTFDRRDSVRFFLGARRRDLFGSGAELDLKYTYTDNFTSGLQSVSGELRKEFFGRLDLSAGMTARYESFTFLETDQKRFLYIINADFIIKRGVFLSANIEYSDEDEYNSLTFFTNLSYRF